MANRFKHLSRQLNLCQIQSSIQKLELNGSLMLYKYIIIWRIVRQTKDTLLTTTNGLRY